MPAEVYREGPRAFRFLVTDDAADVVIVSEAYRSETAAWLGLRRLRIALSDHPEGFKWQSV